MLTYPALILQFNEKNVKNDAKYQKYGDFDNLVKVSVLTFKCQLFLYTICVFRVRPYKSFSKQLIVWRNHVLSNLQILYLIDKWSSSQNLRNELITSPVFIFTWERLINPFWLGVLLKILICLLNSEYILPETDVKLRELITVKLVDNKVT